MDSHKQNGVNETAMKPALSREHAAQEHLAVALAAIEEAQRFLDLAGQALCPLQGLASEWRKVGRLYDAVKASWYAVRDKAERLRANGRLRLDHHPEPGELRRLERHARGER